MNTPSEPSPNIEPADTDSSPDPSEPIPTSHALVLSPERLRTTILARLMGWFGFRDNLNIREDIEDALADSHKDGTDLSASERIMLNNVLRLRDVRVADVMIPRGDIEAIDIKTSLAALLHQFEQSGHSRMPVYAESLDDPRGMVHIRDVVAYITKAAQKTRRRKKTVSENGKSNGEPAPPVLDLAKVALDSSVGQLKLQRQVLFVPPSMMVVDLMSRMQAQRIQMALVIDEYGGTDGLVSLEDIVEVIVGDIEDEHDDDEPTIEKISDGVFVADARTELSDLSQFIGSSFAEQVKDMEVDTLGGLIYQALGRIPARREIIKAVTGFEFEVMSVDARRIRNVQIRMLRHPDQRRRAATPSSGS